MARKYHFGSIWTNGCLDGNARLRMCYRFDVLVHAKTAEGKSLTRQPGANIVHLSWDLMKRVERTMPSSVDLNQAVKTFTVLVVILVSVCCQSYTTSLQKTETSADETSVIAAIRSVAMAQQSHAAANEGSFATFPQLVEGGYLDSRFKAEAPEVQGFVLTMKVGEKSYSCNADPVGEQTGRHFYVDSTSPLIRVNATQSASAKDGLLKL